MTYNDVMNYLEEVKALGSVLGLDRVIRLMDYLDRPQDKLRFVHVTGTNGKGSSSAFLANILIAEGYQIGSFNSPFIQRFSEQIRLNNKEISDDELCRATETVKEARSRMIADGFVATTEFETVFAIALIFFVQKNCDIVILEVGMGGKGDATNIIPAPDVAMFAHIALDHASWLGNTIEAIAIEKSGIIKPGCDVVTTTQTSSVLDILKNAGAPVTISSPASIQVLKQTLDGQVFSHPAFTAPFSTQLLGAYQIQNAALAIDTALVLRKRGWTISDEAFYAGIANTRWAGRFELLQKNPAFLIDGAHNPDGIHGLVQSIQRYFPTQKLIMIIGVLADKDFTDMLSQMLPYAKCFHAVTVPNPRALPADQLANVLSDMGAKVTAHDSIQDAIDTALREASLDENQTPILAFGSLYYVGKVRELLFPSN